MKKTSVLAAALAHCLTVACAHAGLVLEFYVGTSQNDTTISLVPFPGGTMTLTQGGAPGFIQVVLRQTAPTALLTPTDGLAAWLTQGVYGYNQANTFIVPATNTLPTGTTPVCNVANPTVYSLVRSYRTGVNGSTAGGNASTATAVRWGGLDLNPPPSPSVDGNGRIFLGTLRINANNLTATPQTSSIRFQDPNPAPTTIDNITNMGDNLDAVLYNGATYNLPIVVNPAPPPPPCPADINHSGAVNIDDLLAEINAWGPCPPPPTACPADVNANGQVNIDDLLAVINNWGSCP